MMDAHARLHLAWLSTVLMCAVPVSFSKQKCKIGDLFEVAPA